MLNPVRSGAPSGVPGSRPRGRGRSRGDLAMEVLQYGAALVAIAVVTLLAVAR
jgi:hypothetical protein